MDEELKELLVERLFLDMAPGDIDSDVPLADYGIDSFLLLELIVGIEEMFSVRFEEADINAETLSSIASLRECIKAKQAASR
jgi:acyl carrier protein